MVRQLAPQVTFTVPPTAAPGPVPSLSPRRTMSPVVTVMGAVTFTVPPAMAETLPVTTVVAAFMSTVPPAL